MHEVEENLPVATREINSHGTDVLAQLDLAEELQHQRHTGTLHVQLATDGIATTEPVEMNTPDFDLASARRAAAQVRVPNLSGATVEIVGIARTSGARQLATERAAAIASFYRRACRRTNANCHVTASYTPGG